MDPGAVSAKKFDEYAGDYAELVADSIRASGESSEYFLSYKIGCLERLGLGPEVPILDYGCGIGSLTTHLAGRYVRVEGFDPSTKSIETARERLPALRFHTDPATVPDGEFGAAVLSGVLHHVPKSERRGLLEVVLRKLTPGGKLVIFEHNPWNPVTRRAIAACPFDDDAVLLWPGELRGLVRDAGFADTRLEYIVFFPRLLSPLRRFEPRLNWLFLGAQTMTVGCRS